MVVSELCLSAYQIFQVKSISDRFSIGIEDLSIIAETKHLREGVFHSFRMAMGDSSAI